MKVSPFQNKHNTGDRLYRYPQPRLPVVQCSVWTAGREDVYDMPPERSEETPPQLGTAERERLEEVQVARLMQARQALLPFVASVYPHMDTDTLYRFMFPDCPSDHPLLPL